MCVYHPAPRMAAAGASGGHLCQTAVSLRYMLSIASFLRWFKPPRPRFPFHRNQLVLLSQELNLLELPRFINIDKEDVVFSSVRKFFENFLLDWQNWSWSQECVSFC